MAMASASELEYHLLLAAELGMLPRSTYLQLETQVKEIKRMLTSLIRRVRCASGGEMNRPQPDARPDD
jgi:four helix bundle protein